MFARVKKSRGEEYLQIVESYRQNGKVRQRLVFYVGHYASIDDALLLMPREVSSLRGRATRRGQVESGSLREAAEERAAKLEALRRLLEEHPEVRERDQARAARHAQRQREAAAKRREAWSPSLGSDHVVPNTTKVINIKSGEPYDVYIGWENGRHRLKRSDWRNPFNEEFRKGEITREESIEKYQHYLLEERPDLVARLPELKRKVLACWCAPEPCHGDVLARLANE